MYLAWSLHFKTTHSQLKCGHKWKVIFNMMGYLFNYFLSLKMEGLILQGSL